MNFAEARVLKMRRLKRSVAKPICHCKAKEGLQRAEEDINLCGEHLSMDPT